MTSNEERAMLLIDNNDGPVDHLPGIRRRQRRNKILAVVATCCLALTLCLAIALPLSSGQHTTAGSESKDTASRMVMASGVAPLMLFAQYVDSTESTPGNSSNSVNVTDLTTSPLSAAVTSSSSHDLSAGITATLSTTSDQEVTDYTDLVTTTAALRTTAELTSEAITGTAPTTWTRPTTTQSWLLPSCPVVPQSKRGFVDLQQVGDSRLWFELYRIQTYNSPAYVESVSCSNMRLTLTSQYEASMSLGWEQGYLWHKERKTITIQLHRNDTISLDWLETYNNNTGQISFLAHIGGYLLIYECFPEVEWRPQPAYIIRVYSTSPESDSSRLDQALLTAASEVWGLNPDELYPKKIRHRYCNGLDNGHA